MKNKPRTFFVYISKNKDGNSNRLYIGSTNNLEKRLEEHRNKKVLSTRRFPDFELVYYEAYISESDTNTNEINKFTYCISTDRFYL